MIKSGRIGIAAFFAAMSVLVTPMGVAEPIDVAHLKAQAPRADHNITTLGASLMGDKANLFNGSLEFEHVDAALPGNSALRVAVVRSHKAGRHTRIRGAFGDWDLEAPRIGGSFPAAEGWTNAQGNTARCSNYSAPRYVSRSGLAGGGGDSLGARPPQLAGSAKALPNPDAKSTVTVTYYPHEFWGGNLLVIPGSSGQEVLVRNSGDAAAPTDGNAWPLLTRDGWQLRCLGFLQNGAGEGFIALSPEGTQYRFDWLTTRFLPTMKGASPSVSLGRNEVMLAATLVTDRFGNTVSYTYSGSKLTGISASDGRSIAINYAGDTVSSISDGSRTWTYSYSGGLEGSLTQVTMPDTSRWQFNLRPLVHTAQYELGEGANCNLQGAWPESTYTGTVTHPSGAVGTFDLRFITHGREGVTKYCINKSGLQSDPGIAYWQRDPVSQTLVRKAITGPGMNSMTWVYDYPATPGSWAPCNGCVATKVVSVTDPRGYVSRHTFGTLWHANEGQLIRVDDGYNANANTATRTTTQSYRASGPWQEPAGGSVTDITDYLAIRHRPMDQRVISQDGATFTWQVASNAGFDTRARPVNVTKQSSLGFSKTEATAYVDTSASWVLGQLGSITVNAGASSAVQESNTYHATTGNRLTSSSFGRLTSTYTWYANGLLQTHQDPAGQSTSFSNYMRGIAREVGFADGTTQTASVNNLGLVTSLTNEAGTTTTFGYDVSGRLASIAYPNESGLTYQTTTQVFEPVAGAEYGIGAGHWRQTISTGNARMVRYYDALWRERLVGRWDAANPGATSRFVETRYDANGGAAFTSYAQRAIGAVDSATAGTGWARDALGRVLAQYQDSELGQLAVTTDYLTGFQKRVTNPRGYATTTSYQAFDEPGEAAITAIAAPEGVSVAINRDVFGKPLSITRSGPYAGSGPSSVTRSHVYDGYQRLCKTVEPEIGATVEDYDAAGNTAWRAAGLSLTGTGSCDTASVPAEAKVAFTYDARNRLIGTGYGDGSPSIGRAYTADGLPLTVVSNGSTWTYGYNNRRLLTSESLSFPGGGNWGVQRAYDANGSPSTITYPDGANVALSPNALGQPTQVGGYATNVSHHPNGAVASYTLGNGIVHSLSQNTRGLPLVNRDAGVMQDQYGFDANGNVSGITDQQEGIASRSMGYDGLDRLTTANSPNVWGNASYGYDGLDNLRTSSVGPRSTTHGYDAANRLSSLTVNGAVTGYAYDSRGNITGKGSQGYYFDQGNRLQLANGVASYAYDGLGRRVLAYGANGTNTYQLYSQDGQLLIRQPMGGGANNSYTLHLYLGGKAIAEHNSASGVTYLHTDALGSPVAKTNTAGALLSRTRYEAYGNTSTGTTPTGIGFTGHANDAESGLVYMQARYYDPFAGRFLSVDPVTTDANTGSAFNRFGYANNNPYRYTDPNGKFAIALLPAVFEAVATWITATVTPTVVATATVAAGAAAIATSNSGADGKNGAAAPAGAAGAPGATSGQKDRESTLRPGPNAGDSIPARGPGRDFTPDERSRINDIGNDTGCHTCGSRDPGTKSGNFVPDHQPPNGLNPSGGPQRLYPQCLGCSRTQGGQVRGAGNGG